MRTRGDRGKLPAEVGQKRAEEAAKRKRTIVFVPKQDDGTEGPDHKVWGPNSTTAQEREQVT